MSMPSSGQYKGLNGLFTPRSMEYKGDTNGAVRPTI